ncbi:MAG: hypothetical protein KAR87_04320 [Candidatus Aenigmarchaeota archaeon]|nr:hypothetical protein [Candidatus Aenigmarchaeota archaeon]
MNFRKCLFVSALLLILILSSGCSKEQSNPIDGLIIADFQITPKEAYGGEEVGVYVVVKNTGLVEADDITVSIKEDGFSPLNNKKIDSLDAKKNTGTSLNEELVEWTATANQNNNPFDIYYKPTAKVCGHYQTKAILKIKSMSKEEYQMLKQRGQIPSDYLKFTQTEGPVQIAINTNPVIIKTGAGNEQIKINVELQNNGLKYGGSVYAPNTCLNTNINKATITAKVISTGDEDTKTVDFLRGRATYRVEFDAP